MHGETASATKVNDDRKAMWAMIIDAAIIGGISVFAAIGTLPFDYEMLGVAFKAFGGAFLLQLAIERGIKRPTEESDHT